MSDTADPGDADAPRVSLCEIANALAELLDARPFDGRAGVQGRVRVRSAGVAESQCGLFEMRIKRSHVQELRDLLK